MKLQCVIDRCLALAKDDKHPLAVFDLDSTLFNNGPRTVQILKEFALESGHGDLAGALSMLPTDRLPYLIEDILRLTNCCDDKMVGEGVRYWQERFFTNHYQQYDRAEKGAQAFINELHDIGATIVYFSGRDVPNMLIGCTKALQQAGFPIGLARTVLLLKSDFDLSDADFKSEAVNYIDKLGAVVATFDNEPYNCNLFIKRWPSALNFFLDTNHAPGAPKLLDGIRVISDFV